MPMSNEEARSRGYTDVPDWKTAEEWAKIHDAMSPEEHRELKAKQRDEGKVPVMHPWWTPEALCGTCGETFKLHYWPAEGGRCTIDKDGPAFERCPEPSTTYGRIAGGGAFPRAPRESAGVDIPQVSEGVSSKIVVPEGMWDAAQHAASSIPMNGNSGSVAKITVALEAALRWLAEHPMAPTDEQLCQMSLEATGEMYRQIGEHAVLKCFISNWQRRMFLAPEPQMIGEETLEQFCSRYRTIGEAVREAYRRGQQSKR